MTQNLVSTEIMLALSVDPAENGWIPRLLATVGGAHNLTKSIITCAFHALESERGAGAVLPPLEIGGKVNPSYEAVLRERALNYLQALQVEADASIMEIIADIFERQLYLYHPDQWSSLAEFIENLAVGKASSYRSVMLRLAGYVVPYIAEHNLLSIQEVMALVIEGGLSNLYHLLPELQHAIAGCQPEVVKQILNDARSLPRQDVLDKYKRGKARIPPAPATLASAAEGQWELRIMMTESQKTLIMARLGARIKLEEYNESSRS